MTYCELYSKDAARNAVLSAVKSGLAASQLIDRTQPQASLITERSKPARIVILAPVLGSCLWALLIYALFAAF